MNTMRRFWLVLIGAILFLAVIACSTSVLAPTPTLPPPPTVAFSPTVPPQTMAGLAGSWLDPDTGTVTTIIALEGGYTVDSVINPNRGGNELASTDWSNGILTWIYCVPGGACITTEAVPGSGDSLATNWSNDQGA